MTDYEMTKHCAELLGLGYIRRCDENPRAVEYNADPNNEAWMIDCPLDEDGEAFALLTTYDIVVEREKNDTFGVTLFSGDYKNGRPTFVVRNQPSLNRALVEVVAKYAVHRATESTAKEPGRG